jgi:hypothetical protein
MKSKPEKGNSLPRLTTLRQLVGRNATKYSAGGREKRVLRPVARATPGFYEIAREEVLPNSAYIRLLEAGVSTKLFAVQLAERPRVAKTRQLGSSKPNFV